MLAAFDVRTGAVFGQVVPHRSGDALVAFITARHGGRFHFVYTPKHASWMNQIEIWFSILQGRVIRHGSFVSHAAQRKQILGDIKCRNRNERHPFRWTWRATGAENRQRQVPPRNPERSRSLEPR